MKLKIFEAIGATFAFVFRHALDILLIVWLPAVLQVAAFVFLLPDFLATTTMMGVDQPVDMQEAWVRLAPVILQLILFIVLFIALSVMMFAGLTRLVVQGTKPRLPFLLRWSADEWRVLATWALLFLIGLGLWLAIFVILLVTRLLSAMGPGPGNILGVIGFLVVCCVGVWIYTRFSLLTPATIARQKIGVQDCWETTEENFWNLFGFWLIWGVLAVVAQLLLGGYLTPPGYSEALQSGGFGSPDKMREAIRKANTILAESYNLSDVGNLARMVASAVLNIVWSVIAAIAAAVAWRQMTDEQIEQPDPLQQPGPA